MAGSNENPDRQVDELFELELSEEVEGIYDEIDVINDRLDNFVTREELAKAKAELTWRFVPWTLGFMACIAAIVGVVIAALSYLSG